MKRNETSFGQQENYGGGKFSLALCSISGTLILVLVVLSALPLTIPRLFGYEVYHVVSGSMEPEIPVGSILYVKQTEPVEIQEQEIIAYRKEGSVITHRVLKNQQVEGRFVTKGDANAEEDMLTVSYTEVIGTVEYHYPYLGDLLVLYASTAGKVYVLCFAVCGVMLNILAGMIRRRRREEIASQLQQQIRRKLYR